LLGFPESGSDYSARATRLTEVVPPVRVVFVVGVVPLVGERAEVCTVGVGWDRRGKGRETVYLCAVISNPITSASEEVAAILQNNIGNCKRFL